MPTVPDRVVWVVSVWDLGDVSGMQTQAPPSSSLRTHPPCLLSLKLVQIQLRAFQFWQGRSQEQLQADTFPPGAGQRSSWTWECSGCKCTTAFLLQLCKKFLFHVLVLLGVLQLFPPPSTFCTANSCFSPSVWLCNPWLVSNQPFSLVMNGLTFCFLMSNRKNVSELSKNNWN